MDHFQANDILTENQFGFRENMSTTIATYRLINEILQALNNKNNSGGIFFI
jgi:hypothetical protein